MHATIQVDLDSLWTYNKYLMKKNKYDKCDPVYSRAVQDFLFLLDKCNIKATFFVIGKDAENPEHKDILQEIVSRGHEIANHSMDHPRFFSELSDQDISEQIKHADNAIFKSCKVKPVGFKAPMFSVNERVVRNALKLGYKYDASLVPSAVFPFLMIMAHSIVGSRPANPKIGRLSFAKAPRDIYQLSNDDMTKTGTSGIFELPLSVSGIGGIPIHSSFVFASGDFFLKRAIKFYKKKNICFNYLFHGIDLVDISSYGIELPFFGTVEKRKKTCGNILKMISAEFETKRIDELIKVMRPR